MRFEVPQFIEIEDKLFGPLTLKQFIYVVGTLGLSFIIFTNLPLILAVIFIVPLVIFGFALAFYKHNNRPFIVLLESWFNYMFKDRLYIWKKREKEIIDEINEFAEVAAPELYVPKLSDSKLKDLSWSLDVQEGRRQDVL